MPIKSQHLIITPKKKWFAFNFSELLEYKDLFFVLVKRDIMLRYQQTAIGIIWIVLQPLLTTFFFTAVFGRLASLPSDGIPYSAFAFSGMLPWAFFAQSVQRACGSVVGEARLITKVYFPRILVPTASVSGGLIDFFICFIMMMGMILFYKIPITKNLLFLPVFTGILFLFTLGIGYLISALNAYYRDFGYALPFTLQMGMFASPVVYSLSVVSSKWFSLYICNPLAGIIDGFRWCLFGQTPFPTIPALVALGMTIFFFLLGIFTFKKVEGHFADIF